MKYALGIDIGTSGTKTVLFDRDGKRIASKTAEYPLLQPHNGWAEQRPEDWWEAAKTGIRAVLNDSGIDASCIVGIGLTGQMHGLVMLDGENRVLRPAIIWCDQRTAAECEELEHLVGKERLVEITCNPALTGFTASKILWVKKHEPQIFARCKKILLPKDYIRFCLTAEYATDVSDAGGMQLLDIRGRCWSEEVLTAMGLKEEQLGRVYESCEITGSVTQKAAEETGLCAGIPVVAGAGDNAAAAVGAGVVRNGDAFTTVGTSGVVYAHADEVSVDPKGRIHTFCCAVPGAWHVMGVTQAAGLSLRWIRDTACADLCAEAQKNGIDPYVLMSAEAEQAEAGADRLIYLPYLMGERTPHLDPNARGVFFGLSARHTRRELIRSVMEGVSFSLKDCLTVFEEMQIAPTEMRLCGGGARSELWRQIMTDIFGIPSVTLECEEGPAFGAAILALVGAGEYSSVQEACSAIVRINEKTEPKSVPIYTAAYPIYQRLYARLKEEYEALSEL